ncbi:MAG: DUF615 domain-containing protein [Zoogloeaceae bacterium]|jgi:ribosome-associated protein|nr:DUF615 domain-containing protein [Zoogloeaceae bacterium]
MSVDIDAPERPSKTRIKAAMRELQALGESLTRLSPAQLQRLGLPAEYADLEAAVREHRRVSGFEAKRRQLQFIGRLMRGLDPEPVRAALAASRGESASERAHHHRLECLRAIFLDDAENGLREIMAAYPRADPARLGQLRRAVLKERAEGKPPRQFRALFRCLKALEREDGVANRNEPCAEISPGHVDPC